MQCKTGRKSWINYLSPTIILEASKFAYLSTTKYSQRFEFPQFQKSEINFSKPRRTVPTRIVSLNRIVHLSNLNRFVRAWTVLSAKIISYPTVKIRVQQKVILLENFDQKTIRFNPYCPYWKFWAKDNTVQPILSFKKTLTKRQYGSTHIVF